SVQKILAAAYQIGDTFTRKQQQPRTKVQLDHLHQLLRVCMLLLSSQTPHGPESTAEYQFVAVLARLKGEKAVRVLAEDLIDFYVQRD
ncbi:hypothetical protein HDU98_000984, partial [Podochytrium sp. JEL0797]